MIADCSLIVHLGGQQVATDMALPIRFHVTRGYKIRGIYSLRTSFNKMQLYVLIVLVSSITAMPMKGVVKEAVERTNGMKSEGPPAGSVHVDDKPEIAQPFTRVARAPPSASGNTNSGSGNRNGQLSHINAQAPLNPAAFAGGGLNSPLFTPQTSNLGSNFGIPNQRINNLGIPNFGNPNPWMNNLGIPNFGNPNPWMNNLGVPNFGNPNPGINIGIPNFGNPNLGVPNFGNPNPWMNNLGVPNFWNPNLGRFGNPSLGIPNFANLNLGVPNFGNPNFGNPNFGIPNFGNPNPAIPRPGLAPNEEPEDGLEPDQDDALESGTNSNDSVEPKVAASAVDAENKKATVLTANVRKVLVIN